MAAYEANGYQPPAPVAFVEVHSSQADTTVANVPMLLDTGADVSLLPKESLDSLLTNADLLDQYELESFDGTRSMAQAVQCEIRFLGKTYRGKFLLTEGTAGILGRNVLNSLNLVFDGPRLTWKENR